MTRAQAFEMAQALADSRGTAFEVHRHVGDYGRRGGDIPATGEHRVVPFGTELPACWALLAIAEPALGVPPRRARPV
jgi:hypothetical protein